MPSTAAAKKAKQASQVNQLLENDHVPWYRKKNLRLLYFTLVPAALGVEMTSGYDGSVLNGLQAVDPWNAYFDHPQGAVLGVINAAFSIGAFVVLPIVPFINDRFGRKACVLLGTLLVIVGSILQTASINVAMFLVSRIILGFGIPFAISGASQLIAELAYPKERSIITGLFNESWYAGAILAAGVVLGTYSWPNNWSWRLPSLFQMLPASLQLVFIWFVPESPRWLVSKDRHEEALEILIKYHAEGDRNSQFVAIEFEQIRATIKMELESTKSPWQDLVKSPANRRRVFIAACVGLFSQWSGNGLVSYYLAKILSSIGITDRKTQNQINLGLSSWNLVVGILASFVTHSVMRRNQYLFSYTGMTVLFASLTAGSAVYANDSTDHAAAKAVVALIFLYYTFYNIMMPLTYIYITELFPFIHRSKGVAITQFFSRGGNAFNLFVNPIGLLSLQWKYYLVFVAWLAIETLIIFFVYPETKGPSLEEIAMIVEGPGAKVGVIMADGRDRKDLLAAQEVEKV